MYYVDNSQEYNEKNNTDSYRDHDDDVHENMPNYGQQTPYSPQYYQMMPFYPMMHMPVIEDDDEDLKMLYPKIYIRIFPMVKHHCDMMTSMYGTMYCPSIEDMDHISKEMYEKYEKHYKDDEDDDNHNDDDDMRQRRRSRRRRGFQDLFRILFIRELLGRRHDGGYWW